YRPKRRAALPPRIASISAVVKRRPSEVSSGSARIASRYCFVGMSTSYTGSSVPPQDLLDAGDVDVAPEDLAEPRPIADDQRLPARQVAVEIEVDRSHAGHGLPHQRTSRVGGDDLEIRKVAAHVVEQQRMGMLAVQRRAEEP